MGRGSLPYLHPGGDCRKRPARRADRRIIRARQERGITQKQLEKMSGVTQPVIARLERGTTSPNVSTLMKVLAPLGKKLAIVPM